MRRLAQAWVWLVVAAAMGLALYGRASSRAVPQVAVNESPRAESASDTPGELTWGSPEELRTLPVTEAASEGDGLLELRVMAGGRPVPRAQVRLYRREGLSRETGKMDWRIAASGATGNDGKLLMPARAGSYLLVARANGFAPARLNLMHPLGGPRTPAILRMEEASTFWGTTVLQGSGRALPGAELTFTPDVRPWEQGMHAAAPAEERVTVTSDASGRFRVEGLAPGLYLVEGLAPGSTTPVEWTLWLPSSEPRVLALTTPGTAVRKRIVKRAPSSELRCGD
ncbi:carboxypeptidase-like regulatory domain-containing protein [Hyalangium minutum]|uniref:Carboxypeptidase regulatory-like domain-containing protein n=1 Tax=Hyalangium minutum TaxID=394096 RepID=A0A085WMR3_9BACT|nr:carboxypeptidase-like regulatory domain-containing protein [Hyalangium minutum]KFE68976.1 hypothetical protein DB31_6878 [Hyalangium minutum]